MSRKGVLPPAQSGEFIAQHAHHVKIHEEGIDKLCKEIVKSCSSSKLQIPDTGTNIIRPSKDDPQAADWVFVADALNFCFWSYTGAEKWTVDGQSGYYALEAALSRALKEGHDISNPEYYSKMTGEQLRNIMRSDNNIQMPLFNERMIILHEVGKILLEKYDGTFINCLKQANNSAKTLLEIVVENFPSFRDEVVFNQKKVSLYKRAQILIADLWSFFDGKDLGKFYDIDCITMFADYRVPQVLAYFGALSYSEELMQKLMKDELLPSGSDEEIEIRGCSIHAVELLKKKVKEELNDQDVEVPNSSLIDYYLWCYRRKYAEEMESIPFHKTLGIYY